MQFPRGGRLKQGWLGETLEQVDIDDHDDDDDNDDDGDEHFIMYVHTQHCIHSRAESFFGGKVDVLVNNAGVSPVLPFDTVMKVCANTWIIIMIQNQVNLDGVLHGAKLFSEKQSIEPGVGGPGGLVVNTASLAGILYGMDKNRCLLGL